VHFKPHLHQVFNHLLNQPLIHAFLHRHNHKNQLLALSF
jgi:hypothetical protein